MQVFEKDILMSTQKTNMALQQKGSEMQSRVFFSFFRGGGKNLKIWRRLRRAFFAYEVIRLFLLIFREGSFFEGGEKSLIFFEGEFSPLGGGKKTLIGK